jgi:pyruvate dehydrogenase E2 component (dihydrolipoamide acetyltransferase)
MEFKLPELGEGVHEGELVKWKVKPGDQVKYDQPLCEIMTDKATVEIPSAVQGKVQQLHCKEGEVVHVGQLMLSFEGAAGAKPATAESAKAATAESAKPAAPETAKDAAKPAPAPVAAKPAEASKPAAAPAAQAATMAAAPTTGNGRQGAGQLPPPSAPADSNPATRILAAPATRRMARELGVDLARVRGSGDHGRVMRQDLLRAPVGPAPVATPGRAPGAVGPQPGAQTEERVPFRGLRKKIAEKMRLSKDHAAHFTYAEEADATALVALRAAAKEVGAQQGIKVTYLPFIMKAMVAALKKFPIMNSSYDEEKQELVYKHYFNISLSVQTEDGLSAPVIKGVDQKSILQLAAEIDDVVTRARNKKLTIDDFHGGTITLTNAGSIGGLFATPIINYPEVAILGFNKIVKRPVVVDDQIVIREWTIFSLSLDHRVVDGAIGAEWMKLFVKYIETPSLLLLENL